MIIYSKTTMNDAFIFLLSSIALLRFSSLLLLLLLTPPASITTTAYVLPTTIIAPPPSSAAITTTKRRLFTRTTTTTSLYDYSLTGQGDDKVDGNGKQDENTIHHNPTLPSSKSSSSSSLSVVDRRQWFTRTSTFMTTTSMAVLVGTVAVVGTPTESAVGQIYLDPAMYGDQELRVSAVDTVREAVRRRILQNPQLAPAYYQLALLDALSYQVETGVGGPDGWAVYATLATKIPPTTTTTTSTTASTTTSSTNDYMKNLQQAAASLLETERNMRQKNAITLADAVAIAGAESIESIGGPILPVQLGRSDHKGILPTTVPLDLLSGQRSNIEVVQAFQKAGLTEREMTALLAGLLTLEMVEAARVKNGGGGGGLKTSRPKFREAGKLGRMSEFKPLTEEDIAQAELEAELEDPDDGWYIADSFGTRETRFGQRLAKDEINEQTFNKYLQLVMDDDTSKNSSNNKKDGNLVNTNSFGGWTADLLLDTATVPTAVTWMKKYSGANLSFTKDLKIAYNSATQLGAQYTGGKYENLLKNKPRKTLLNDDGLNLF